MAKKEIDKITGTPTTGHDWDGIKELDTPTPRWWLWTWLATIIFSVWYMFAYPVFPGVDGYLGWTQHKQLKEQQAEIMERQAKYLGRFEASTLQEVTKDAELLAFAKAGGNALFKDNCAMCHGSGAAGFKGYPNLNDDDWLWGGSLEEIQQTITYGIRAENDDTHDSIMMAFGKDEMLEPEQIEAVANHVLSLSGKAESSVDGALIFAENCAACHNADGTGDREFGAPNLADEIWLYGGSIAEIKAMIHNPANSVMPAWVDRLDKNAINKLTVYIHSLGGGE